MEVKKTENLKTYIRVINNIGYAFATLLGLLCGVALIVLFSDFAKEELEHIVQDFGSIILFNGVVVINLQNILSALICIGLILVCIVVAALVAGLGCFVVWLVSGPVRKNEKDISLGVHILLSILFPYTWSALWVGHTSEYLNVKDGKPGLSSVAQMCLYMFVPYYCIYWYYRQGAKLDGIRNDGQSKKIMYLVLGILIPFVGSILMQDEINKIQ